MYRGFRGIAVFALIAGLSACTTPHHSNALIFGTNTSFGIDVGQSATGTPSILIGYHRQEAVFMPLVANVSYDDNGTPTACAVYPGVHYDAVDAVVVNDQRSPQIPPCFLVGQNGGSLDSYSVLASFGAQFEASATNPTASGGLAQFFATGIAAQLLAIRGGPALVATGTAAATTGAADTDNAIEALYNAPEIARRSGNIVAGTPAVQSALADYVTNHTTDQNVLSKLTALETAAGVPAGTLTPTLCATANRANCVIRLNSALGAQLLGLYNDKDWTGAIARQIQPGG